MMRTNGGVGDLNKEEQYSNAWSPMDITESGMVTEVRDSQHKNVDNIMSQSKPINNQTRLVIPPIDHRWVLSLA